MKKLAALLLLFLMMTCVAAAEIEWPASPTAGQTQLMDFVAAANAALAEENAGVIDMRYEMYSTFASLGMNGVEMPDDPFADFTMPAEMYFTMTGEGLHTMQLRMPVKVHYSPDSTGIPAPQLQREEVEHFAAVAAACIHAASPTAMSMELAMEITELYANSICAAPANGFDEQASTLQSSQPRAYFAYFPNQFRDNEYSWIQLTLVFARPGSADAPIMLAVTTPAPEAAEGVYLAQDNYTHLELFATPTPEPDSATME